MTGSDPSDLLRPTILPPPGAGPGARPWRLRSQLYVAFLGGILAVTAIAWMNSRRLGMSRAGSRLIAIAGLAASLAGAAIGAWLLRGALEAGMRLDPRVRLAYRAASLAMYALFHRMQAKHDRLYGSNSRLRDGQEYASLWAPGAIASIAGTAAQFLLMLGALAVLR